ncbi:asparagine synthetase B [Spirosoma sp.]|uniref:asparagine synthetase B family protein n=1 Tax=Spirosoma sp. TaxID=1899569 RepID=UPI0026391ACB|nr:asparagine synthetase B [Spirosoma sp.]MCX6217892.1 asparagine synthetase B [Spirosoma sp.]
MYKRYLSEGLVLINSVVLTAIDNTATELFRHMGGIAGIIRFDGQNVLDTDRSRVIELLKHRGNPTSQVVSEGVLLAFGGRLERTGFADATIDIDQYAGTKSGSFSDTYSRSGFRSLNDLTADFALALWDQTRQTLVCARDCMGIKPLYYVHQPGRFVAFASEIKALLALREVVVRPNEHKFREYLTWSTEYIPYSTETFHNDIFSLLPGHYVEMNAQGVEVLPYWQVDCSRYADLASPNDYSALFQTCFTEAVDRRMAGKKLVGAHLSGGLDSSSVSCVAQALLQQQQRPALHTFNIDTEQPSADEQAFVQAVVDQWHPSHHTVHPISDVLDSVLKINRLFDRPEHFIIPSSFHLSVSEATQQVGCDSLLTGHDGDSVATTGFDFLEQLVDAADWANLKTVCQQVTGLPGRNLVHIDANWTSLSGQAKFDQYALSVIGSNLKKRFREQSITDFLIMFRTQKATLELSSSAFIRYLSKRLLNRLTATVPLASPLSDAFDQRVPVRAQQTTSGLTAGWTAGQQMPLNQILNTTNVICNEQMNHIGEYYGHSYSFPFFDKNVIELCLTTPLTVHFDQGRGRGLIRNGLGAVLPPAVTSRLTKANFVEYSTLSAQQLYQATRELFSSATHSIWTVVDRQKFDQLVKTVFDRQLPVSRKTRFNWMLCRVIYLALWLDTLPKTP